MGRRKGSKNTSKFHKAGGSRAGAGRPRNIDQDKTQTKISFFAPAAVNQTVGKTDSDAEPDDPEPEAANKNLADEENARNRILEKLKQSLQDGSFDVAMEMLPDDDDDDDEDDHDNDESARAKYKPPEGSPVYNILNATKDQVKSTATNQNHRNFKAVHSQSLHWIQPDYLKNPVAKGGGCDASLYYRQNLREVYVWMPFYQYSDMCQLCNTRCVGCGKKSLESHQYDWRPMFYFDRIIWVIHRRFRCKEDGCAKTMASIDPKFLKCLPMEVSEQYEFLSTTNREVGMHKEMLFQFLELITDRIQFGSFAVAFNNMYKRKYWQEQLSYYNTFLRTKNNSVSRFWGQDYPEPFSAFGKNGEYNGILLSKKTVKGVFLQFAKDKEEYLQAGFQLQCDEGTSRDHTFKYAKVIKAPGGRKGDAFGSSYTIMSHAGLVNALRLTYTKSPLEIGPLLVSYKAVRVNAGAPALAVSYSDDVKGDGAAWEVPFKDNLSHDVQPFQHSPICAASPIGQIPDDDHVLICSTAEANHWVEALRCRMGDELTRPKRILVGIDTEFHNGASDTDVLTLSYPGQPVGLFHLAAMKVIAPTQFPTKLKELLQEDNIFFCARSIGTDSKRLLRLGVKTSHHIEISQMAMALDNQPNGTSLAALALRYLNLNVDKSFQRSDYSQIPLPKHLQKYAALDALLHRKLAIELTRLLEQKRSQDSILIAPLANHLLTTDTMVEILIGGKKAATAKVVFAYKDGESKVFPNGFEVGKDKAIVEITSVVRATAKIPKCNQNFRPEWPAEVSIGWVWKNAEDKQIAVFSSNLVVAVKSDDSRQLHATLDKSNETNEMENADSDKDKYDAEIADGSSVVKSDDEELGDDNDDVGNFADDEVDSLLGGIRTRQQEDLWHQMKNLPLAKGCVYRRIISRLIVQATYLFEENDFNQMAGYLKQKLSLHTNDEVMDHFYRNREFWRKRVRMPTYSPEEHAKNVRVIHDVVATDEDLCTIYDDEVKKYFESFERKCAEGRFAELEGVARFVHVGMDKSGFDLWIRLSGSVRCENFHMIMRRAMGPWAVGAKLAHYLLLLIGSKYNVNCAIQRRATHDFGHWHLYIMDALQIAIQEIYNVLPFPRHQNVSLSNPVRSFVAVGIGPLSISHRYVTKGPPSLVLKADVAFIARQMGVTIPPLPPSDREEFKIMKNYWIRNPRPTKRNHEELAAIFLQKSDGIRIFPKLPSMFPKLFKERQQRNEYEKILGRLIRSGRKYGFLLRQLEGQRAKAGSVEWRSIVESGRHTAKMNEKDRGENKLKKDRGENKFDIAGFDKHRDIPTPEAAPPFLTTGILNQNFLEQEELDLLREKEFGDDKDIVAEDGQWSVSRRSMRRLLGDLWMNDEPINFFCQRICSGIDTSSFVFNTFFYSKLADRPNGYNYQNVQRWTRSKNIFGYRLVIFPINVNDQHWIVGVVFVEEKRVWLWDSYGGHNSDISINLLHYLDDEHRVKLGQPLPGSWYTSHDSRRLQQGSIHCGAFICTVIYLLLSNQPLNFTEAQMHTVRKRIALQILSKGRGSNNGSWEVPAMTVSEPGVVEQQTLTAKGPVASLSSHRSTALPSNKGTKPSSKGSKDCFYFPFCKRTQSLCGGIRRGHCSFIDEDRMLEEKAMTWDDFLMQKREAKNKEKAKRVRAERHNAQKVAKQKII